MKQKQYAPLSVAEMALSLFAANEGYLDDVDVDQGGRLRGSAARLRMRSNNQARCSTRSTTKTEDDDDYNDEVAAPSRRSRSKTHKATATALNRGEPTFLTKRSTWQAAKKSAPRSLGQEHAEDHQRDGDGGGEQDAQGAGPHGGHAPLRGAHPPVIGHLASANPSTSTRSCRSARSSASATSSSRPTAGCAAA